MDKYIISEGKTTAEAIENGLNKLKVSKNDVEIEILKDENKKSFFSILTPRNVRVKLILKEKKEGIKEYKEKDDIISETDFYKIKENIGWPYKTRGATIGGIWYGPAVTLESNVTKLHQEIYGQADYVPSKTVKQISNEVIKKTGYTK